MQLPAANYRPATGSWPRTYRRREPGNSAVSLGDRYGAGDFFVQCTNLTHLQKIRAPQGILGTPTAALGEGLTQHVRSHNQRQTTQKLSG